MDEELRQLLHDIRGDLVSVQTELLLMKFAVDKIEQQVEALHETKQQPQDPFANMPGMRVERL
jgi:cell division septum initiation protein DivIVA